MRPEAATLRLAVFPRSDLTTNVLLVLAGTGFVAIAAQVSISLPFTPVPITGQTFAVVLVGGLIISSFYVGDDTSTSNGRIRGAEATQTVPD